MRGASAKDLYEKDDQVFLPNIHMFQRWEPVVDGLELSSHPFKLLADGKSHDIPIISGSNTNEGSLFTYLDHREPMSNTTYQGVMDDLWSNIPGKPSQNLNPTEIRALLRLYPGKKSKDNRHMLSEASGDAIFTCANRFAAKLHRQRARTWTYRFNHRAVVCGFPVPYSDCPGVVHASEVQNIFDNTNGCDPEPESKALTVRMQKYWANFAKYLDPNGVDASSWPEYTPSGQIELVLQDVDAIQDHYNAELCAFWEDTLYSKVL